MKKARWIPLDAARASRLTTRDIANLIQRGYIPSIHRPGKGNVRIFTFQEIVKLALTRSLMDGGLGPREAADIAFTTDVNYEDKPGKWLIIYNNRDSDHYGGFINWKAPAVVISNDHQSISNKLFSYAHNGKTCVLIDIVSIVLQCRMFLFGVNSVMEELKSEPSTWKDYLSASGVE